MARVARCHETGIPNRCREADDRNARCGGGRRGRSGSRRCRGSGCRRRAWPRDGRRRCRRARRDGGRGRRGRRARWARDCRRGRGRLYGSG